MIRCDNDRDRMALRNALIMLEQFARRSRDKNTRILADGAAADLRAQVEPSILEPSEVAS